MAIFRGGLPLTGAAGSDGACAQIVKDERHHLILAQAGSEVLGEWLRASELHVRSGLEAT